LVVVGDIPTRTPLESEDK